MNPTVIPLGVGDYMVASNSKPGYYARLTISDQTVPHVTCTCENGQVAKRYASEPRCHHLGDVTAFLRDQVA